MRKNVASQTIAFQMNSVSDGSPVTSGTPIVYYVIDGGTQATGTGTAAHEGNGCWSYAPVQAETNGAHVAFTMALSGAISQSVNVWPVAYDPGDVADLGLSALTGHTPQTGDSFSRIGAPAGASVSADVAAVKSDTAAVLVDTNQLQGDWTDGGRLDLIVDAIKAVTDNLPNSGALTDLATAAALVTVDTVVDGIKAVTDNLPDAGALTSIATAAALTAVDTVVDAIQVKTDSLTFSTANKVDSRVDYVGAHAVTTPDDFKADVSALATAAAVATVDTVVDVIQAKTDNLPADPASETNVDANEVKIDAVDTVVDAIKVVTDALTAAAAAKLALSAGTMVSGAATSGTLSTTQMTASALAESTDDHYIGRIIIWTSGVLANQATDITDYTGATRMFTYTAVTEAPGVGDTFVII